MTEIYLDNNATTRALPEVIECLAQHARDSYANPGSRHAAGRRARRVLEASRESLAAILGADPDEVIFTSGGTEANNMAVLGFTAGSPGTIVLTAGEHPSVREACLQRQAQGWRLHELPVDSRGLLRAEAFAEIPWDTVKLVCVILAHNETGVIQDLGPLAALCLEHRIPLLADGVQAVGKVSVNFHALQIAALSLGAHKFYGPRGVGALLLRRGYRLAPIAFGGHQESERRPGTEAVPLIAAMARALELYHADEPSRTERLTALRDRLQTGLSARCAPVVINGEDAARLPNTLNISFPGVDGEALLVSLDLAGIACSLGSTCASGSAEPAPVLVAMGCAADVLRSSIRLTVGIENTLDEMDRAVNIISDAVARLREIHP